MSALGLFWESGPGWGRALSCWRRPGLRPGGAAGGEGRPAGGRRSGLGLRLLGVSCLCRRAGGRLGQGERGR
ncbi:MAG: hypothetical protein ACLR5H_08060 [Oscillospiraceae bacterium]